MLDGILLSLVALATSIRCIGMYYFIVFFLFFEFFEVLTYFFERHGQTLQWNQRKMDVQTIQAGVVSSLDMIPDSPGEWLV